MSETTEAATTSDGGVERIAADFLAEVRRRLGVAEDLPLAERLASAVSRLTDRLVIVVCDQLARGDMAAFFETMIEGMTEAERSAWRRDVTAGWFRAAERRWQDRQDLRREIVEAILLVKALALT
jgi:hypothetical protein